MMDDYNNFFSPRGSKPEMRHMKCKGTQRSQQVWCSFIVIPQKSSDAWNLKASSDQKLGALGACGEGSDFVLDARCVLSTIDAVKHWYMFKCYSQELKKLQIEWHNTQKCHWGQTSAALTHPWSSLKHPSHINTPPHTHTGTHMPCHMNWAANNINILLSC